MNIENNPRLLLAIGIGLLFPLFFQLSGNIYNSAIPIVDSGRMLTTLPLPISIFACFGGILILLSNYRRAYLGWMFIAGFLSLMSVSLFFAEMSMEIDRRKIILMFQYLLPVFGLILGQMIVDNKKSIPLAFLYTLFLIVPIQLISSWTQGTITLTHNLYLFSVYSHFQYVPLILVCAFSYTMVTLWEHHKRTLAILAFLMFIYALASGSFLTVFACVAFIATFIYSRKEQPLNFINAITMSTALVIVSITAILTVIRLFYKTIIDHSVFAGIENPDTIDTAYLHKFLSLASGELPGNVLERFYIWRLYSGGIIESTKTVILGHNDPLPRENITSAHNWFLDITYTFGLISLLPIFLLIGYTAYRLWQSKEALSGETLWLAAIVFYLVVVDNNFKVTLRQPYPGIFAYFLWGLLLSRLPHRRMQGRMEL